VAVAAQRLLPDVATAPLFLKKRQLAMRVAAVLKETRMSKPRTLLSYTTVCSAALVAVRLAVWMFPMQAPAAETPQGVATHAQRPPDGPGVVVEPGAKILHRTPVFFPPNVSVVGSVIVDTTVNAKGEVTDARIVAGPDELRSAVLASVLNWHFSAEGGLPPTVQTTIRFTTVPKTITGASATLSTSTANSTLYVKSIDMIALSDDLAAKVTAALPVHVGDAFGNDQLASVRAAVKEADEHLSVVVRTSPPDVHLMIMVPFRGQIGGGTPGLLVDEGPARRGPAAPVPAPPAPAPAVGQIAATITAPGPQSIRVGGNVQAMNLIKKVTPLYPPEAKAAGIQGTVRFTATIGQDGSIINLQLVSGHPLLAASAQDAVKQWMYKPTLLNGNPVEVVTQIDVNYTLSQ
jgi:protein TonB